MSSEIEKSVTNTPLAIVAPPGFTPASDEAKKQRAERAARRDEHVQRWKAIVEAGGADKWLEAQIAQKGLTDATADPSALEGASKAAFKERKKAEARERRALKKLIWLAYRATHLAHLGAGIYYRDDEEERIDDKEKRQLRAKGNDLGGFETVDALATGIGVTLPELRWLSFHRDVTEHSHYHIWTIPKRDGSKRTITAPKPELKQTQRWLLQNVFEKLPVHHAAHGFLAARSIVSNAEKHAGADVVVKIDVKDFFPTITFRRVKGLLRKGGLPEGVATVCALLATEPPRETVTFRGRTLYVAQGPRSLPQGAPTSPAITNAICVRLDRRLAGLGRQLGFTYTRYADDLTFSFRKKDKKERAPVGALLHGAAIILRSEGFRIHQKKTAVMRSGMTQRVTGMVINKAGEGIPAARVPRETIRRLKAAIFNREKGKPPKGNETLAELKGMAAFVHMADPKRGRALIDRITALEAKAAG
jgi:hypothetical protein